ncbi:MAG: hypothetical protein LQ337_002810 [Flavoplaca oasis]|nr:MAG: hypothetical protein LQ337_002810 [Flavoplaca oasis]
MSATGAQKFPEAMDTTQSSRLIDSPEAITQVVDTMIALPSSPPSLFIDLEGVSLSRHGTISILQILVFPQEQTYLIDVYSLGFKTFQTPGTDGQTTLKSILEAKAISKVFFDVRNDSDALYAHFGINLAGIQDIQLMELATRNPGLPRKYLNGLTRCIEKDAAMAYEVFNARPLGEDIRAYCIQDVKLMPKLWALYNAKLVSPLWKEKVENATRDRVLLSQSALFNGKGPHMALGPWP